MSEPLIETLLPAHEVHLVAGPTGAGKTRWLLSMLLEWERGVPILGHPTHPVPWIYVAGDRTHAGYLRTLTTLDIAYSRIPVIAAWDERLSLNGVFQRALEGGYKLLVIEGFGNYAGEAANGRQIAQFLQSICAALKQHDLTIIGVVEQPKMKPGAKYKNPRQRVSGPAAWGHHSETIFLVEHFSDDGIQDTRRWLYVCPRNGPALKLRCSLAGGLFVVQG